MKSLEWTEASTREEAEELALARLRSLGFSGGAFSYTPVSRLPDGTPGLIKCAFPINHAEETLDNWLQHANLLGTSSEPDDLSDVPLNHHNDPIRRQMISRLRPKHFDMEKLVRERRDIKNSQNLQWVKALMGFGIRESYSIPVFSGLGEYWSLAALRYEGDPRLRNFSLDELGQLHWLALNLAQFCIDHLKWREMATEKMNHSLYPRELECLYWASQGKTTIETAEILELKTETVRKYIKLANAKLGARNTLHAVTIACRIGYLSLHSDI
jgi:DNA-binding CsgD family transcriptional regulator